MRKKSFRPSSILWLGIGLVAIALLLQASPTLMGWLPPLDAFSSAFEVVAPILTSAGVTLAILGSIEHSFLFKSLRNISDSIVSESTDNLDKAFKASSIYLQQRDYTGLENVLPPLQDEDRGVETRQIISEEITKAKEIRVQSIFGLDFLGGRGFGEGYFRALQDRINAANKTDVPLDLAVKVLLMDPSNNEPDFIADVYNVDGIPFNPRRDFDLAHDGIQRLNTSAQSPFIEWKLYPAIFPHIGLVITDNYAFVELYHFARTNDMITELTKKRLKASALVAGNSGRVPILQFSSESNMYIAMKMHFENIWDTVDSYHKNQEDREVVLAYNKAKANSSGPNVELDKFITQHLG